MKDVLKRLKEICTGKKEILVHTVTLGDIKSDGGVETTVSTTKVQHGKERGPKSS